MVGWRSMGEEWSALAKRRGVASVALVALCLAVYLPGLLRLPAVDRTEVIYAETTRDMVERGAWIDPRYGDQVHQYRPIGTFWVQGAARLLAGDANARDIRIYRLPSMIAVTLAVLALFWFASALVGAEVALIAAALFAVAPLTVLLSQLAIAESLSLLPATIAMLALLRLYSKVDADWRQALIFWLAVGAGILINALLVPILVLATIIALFLMDRDLGWLKRLRPVIGVPLALAIAAPWIFVRLHQDGVPFSGMSWHAFLGALGGAQDMKLRAFPGTFVLAMLLGFLPGTVLLGAAARRFWENRDDRLARYLLAWVGGYIVYLEAISSKPGTYMVQTMFPALALAVASLVVRENAEGRLPKGHWFTWPTAYSLVPLAIFGAVYAFAHQMPSVLVVALIFVIAWLFILSGQQGAEGRFRRWVATSVAALGLLAVTLLGLVLPSIDKIWPSRQIARLAAACPEHQISLLGFREPSARFLLRSDTDHQAPDILATQLTDRIPRLSIIEDRWNQRAETAFESKTRGALPGAALCVSAYNMMRGCPLRFRVYESGDAKPCTAPAEFACDPDKPPAAAQKSGDCD